MSIVEQSTVPQFMSSFAALMEIEVVGVVEHVQAVQNILGSVAVHDIEKHRYAHTMSCIN